MPKASNFTGLDNRWECIIPDYFPTSPNRYRMKHWSHIRKEVIRARELLHVHCLKQGGIPQYKGKVTVCIIRLWGKGQRALDIDNLYGAVKPLLDAMRKEAKAGKGRQGGLGIIQEDNPSYLDLNVSQQKNEGADTEDCRILVYGERIK